MLLENKLVGFLQFVDDWCAFFLSFFSKKKTNVKGKEKKNPSLFYIMAFAGSGVEIVTEIAKEKDGEMRKETMEI